MKIGIISDLHLDFADWNFEEQPDTFYINAGDTCEGEVRRGVFFNQHPDMFWIYGNHDHYRKPFCYMEGKSHTLPNGLKIAGATMWTHMTGQMDFYEYSRSLIDYRMIPGMTYEGYQASHERHMEYLVKSEADIIVTHHAPTLKSVHPRFANDPSNKFFANNFENLILSMEKPPKLWIHGHVHDPFDYMIGETRVVANPRGYPREVNHTQYQPKVIEL